LKTAEAGYLTRRLVESAQGIIVKSPDCGTSTGVLVTENNPSHLATQIYGRYLAQDVTSQDQKVILTRDTLLLEKELKIIQENQITSV